MNSNRRFTLSAGFVAIVLALGMSGCYGEPLNYREQGALGGGIIGAGTGAIIGAAVGNPAAGAAIGGGIGLLSGALIGNQMENERVRNDYTQAELAQQQREIEMNRRMLYERPPVYESEVIRYGAPAYEYDYYYP